jgi:hypothetical protein
MSVPSDMAAYRHLFAADTFTTYVSRELHISVHPPSLLSKSPSPPLTQPLSPFPPSPSVSFTCPAPPPRRKPCSSLKAYVEQEMDTTDDEEDDDDEKMRKEERKAASIEAVVTAVQYTLVYMLTTMGATVARSSTGVIEEDTIRAESARALALATSAKNSEEV